MTMTDHPADTAPEGEPGGRSRRGLMLVGGGAAVILLLTAGATIGRYLLRDRPRAKSVDSAVEQFRADTSTTDAGSAGFVRPAAGVYQAAGEGEERISKPPNSQNDGAVMPISVTYLANGCWTWHLDYNEAHWHEFDFCPDGQHLLLVGQRNYQSWDFGMMKVENVGTYTCDPPAPIAVDDPTPGTTFVHHCTGDNTAAPGPSTTEGPSTIVGPETLSIDGADVATIHQKRSQTMTGTQRGSIEEDWWYTTDTGLPVRSERHYQLDSGSVIGTITYTENGSWQLTSLQPQT
ncbi:MAG: hypothetical protein ACXWA3_04395 [Acidimicrobiales bacterium]